ncbi:hypothetical protein ACHAWO_008694 [Cyclotella atomus]|uniref:Uncharacterized protein n=1 Tax=Cyclotella atomus TaxID=382360 RepID=A0ABD3NBG0_9STRA
MNGRYRLNKNLTLFMNQPAHIVGASRATVDIPAIPPIQAEEQQMPADYAMDIDPPADVVNNQRSLPIARLSKCPRTLHDLWGEYELGLGGFKAAKLFTARERGNAKCKYRRNNFWKIVAEMVRAGESADAAIDKVCRVYGQSRTVTQVLNCIREDNKERRSSRSESLSSLNCLHCQCGAFATSLLCVVL